MNFLYALFLCGKWKMFVPTKILKHTIFIDGNVWFVAYKHVRTADTLKYMAESHAVSTRISRTQWYTNPRSTWRHTVYFISTYAQQKKTPNYYLRTKNRMCGKSPVYFSKGMIFIWHILAANTKYVLFYYYLQKYKSMRTLAHTHTKPTT